MRMMKHSMVAVLASGLVLSIFANISHAQMINTSGWDIVFQETFDGAASDTNADGVDDYFQGSVSNWTLPNLPGSGSALRDGSGNLVLTSSSGAKEVLTVKSFPVTRPTEFFFDDLLTVANTEGSQWRSIARLLPTAGNQIVIENRRSDNLIRISEGSAIWQTNAVPPFDFSVVFEGPDSSLMDIYFNGALVVNDHVHGYSASTLRAGFKIRLYADDAGVSGDRTQYYGGVAVAKAPITSLVVNTNWDLVFQDDFDGDAVDTTPADGIDDIFQSTGSSWSSPNLPGSGSALRDGLGNLILASSSGAKELLTTNSFPANNPTEFFFDDLRTVASTEGGQWRSIARLFPAAANQIVIFNRTSDNLIRIYDGSTGIWETNAVGPFDFSVVFEGNGSSLMDVYFNGALVLDNYVHGFSEATLRTGFKIRLYADDAGLSGDRTQYYGGVAVFTDIPPHGTVITIK